jgi:hypothetical protein
MLERRSLFAKLIKSSVRFLLQTRFETLLQTAQGL